MMPHTYRDEFETLPQFLAAVVGAAGYGPRDPRLRYSAAATGSGEGIPSGGGFLVPEDMASDLWEKAYATGQILNRCDRQPVTTGNALKIPAIDENNRADGSRFGGIQTYWAQEAGTVTATKPKYRMMTLKLKKLIGITYATEELLADAPALASWLRRLFALEASFVVENEVVNGTGAGRPLGILKSGALITVAKETGQVADTVVVENITKMYGRLWGPSKPRAVWLINQDVASLLFTTGITHGTGGQQVLSWGPDGTPRLMGLPVLETEYGATIGDVGDIILADFSQFLLADIGTEFVSSLHVRFLFDEGVFRFTWRIDGQSAWSSPLTPKNSTTTQSPFVTLAARA